MSINTIKAELLGHLKERIEEGIINEDNFELLTLTNSKGLPIIKGVQSNER